MPIVHLRVYANKYLLAWNSLESSGLVVRRAIVEPTAGRHHATNADGVFVRDARVGPVVDATVVELYDLIHKFARIGNS